MKRISLDLTPSEFQTVLGVIHWAANNAWGTRIDRIILRCAEQEMRAKLDCYEQKKRLNEPA